MSTPAKKNSRVYLVNKVKTASPVELVVIAYEGAIGFLNGAKQAMEEKKIKTAGYSVVRAQKVIHALRQALDMDIGEISENLLLLYRFMDKNLMKAIKDKDIKPIGQVISMLSELKEAWQVVASNASSLPQPQRNLSMQDSQYLNVLK